MRILFIVILTSAAAIGISLQTALLLATRTPTQRRISRGIPGGRGPSGMAVHQVLRRG